MNLPGMENHRPQKTTVHDEFEAVWTKYPRKTGKGACRRVCLTRVAQGAKWPDLVLAATNYAASCAAEGRDEKYIKHGSTFFGPDGWWTDHLQPIANGSKEHPFLSAARKIREDRFGDHV